MTKVYNPIEIKINQFLKKYYKNRLLKGVIFFFLLFIIITFLIILLEYFNYFNASTKISLLLIYAFILVLSFIGLLLFPILGYLGIKRNLSKKRINDIVVAHFPEIKDQLWNIFELQKTKSNRYFF